MSDSNQIPDLWTDELIIPEELTPLAILRQQAGLLGEKTKGLVTARIDTVFLPAPKLRDGAGEIPELLRSSEEVGKILNDRGVISHHEFVLVAPALDGYEHELLAVEHDESYFPLVIASDDLDEKFNLCPNTKNFYSTLGAYLNSKKSLLIIRTLAARAAGRKPTIDPELFA